MSAANLEFTKSIYTDRYTKDKFGLPIQIINTIAKQSTYKCNSLNKKCRLQLVKKFSNHL